MLKRSSIAVILILVLFGIGTSQTERWVYRYNGPANDFDRAFEIVYGSDGNIYAVGHTDGIGTDIDFTVIGLTSAGQERWVYRYNGPGNMWDAALSIVYGSDGNIYAAGYSIGIGTGPDITIISLTNTGQERWVYRYSGPGIEWDAVGSIVYGLDGNLYAAGYSGGGSTYFDFTVISLTSAGQERWVYQYNGPPYDGGDYASSIVYGSDGNLYVAGESEGIDYDSDFIVISLTTAGTPRWVYRYDGPGDNTDRANSLVYGADGNVYVAGESEGFGTGYDFAVISLSSTGTQRWVYRYNEPGNLDDYAYSLVYGADVNIYVAGESYGGGPGHGFTVVSLTSTGTERWVYQGNSSDIANSLVYGADGNIYVAGESYGSGTDCDFTVISLTSTGTERWVYQYNGPGNADDYAYSLVYGADGNIYVAGGSYGSGTGHDFTVISLNPAVGIEEETANRLPQTAVRYFRNKIEFSLTLSKPANIPISIYNITGEKVLAFDISASVGTSHHQKDLSFLPTSVYIVKADLENRSVSKKFVVVK